MNTLNIIGRQTALYSFSIGTSIFTLFLCCKHTNWITFLFGSLTEKWIYNHLFTVAIYYIIIAAVVNMIILVPIVVKTIVDKVNRENYLQTTKMMVLNIPIVMLYFYWVIVSF